MTGWVSAWLIVSGAWFPEIQHPEGCQVASLLRFDVEPPNQGAVALMIPFGGLCQLLGATAVRG